MHKHTHTHTHLRNNFPKQAAAQAILKSIREYFTSSVSSQLTQVLPHRITSLRLCSTLSSTLCSTGLECTVDEASVNSMNYTCTLSFILYLYIQCTIIPLPPLSLPPLSLSLSPSLPLPLSPSLPLSLSPSPPLSLPPLSPSPSLPPSPLPLSLSPSPPPCNRSTLCCLTWSPLGSTPQS